MGRGVGRGRKARAAYGFDDIALVPGSLTINPSEVDISWDLCGHRFQIPIIAAAMDGVVSPRLALEMGKHGGLAVLNLEGIFSRYENPDEVLDRITSASLEEATKIIQGIYIEPIKEELIHKRISEIKKGGGPVVVSSIPQRAERFAKIAEEAGADFFVVRSPGAARCWVWACRRSPPPPTPRRRGTSTTSAPAATSQSSPTAA